MSTILQEGNKLNTDTYLELFDFDASMLSDINNVPGQIHYLTNSPTGGGVSGILWRGNTYYSLPFKLTGITYAGDGTVNARPTIAISNINKFFMAAMLSLGNLVGMKITRWRTFYKYTDNGSEPNTNMCYPIDEFLVIKKQPSDNTTLTYELSSVLDRPGIKLPRKLILRDQGFPGVSRVRAR